MKNSIKSYFSLLLLINLAPLAIRGMEMPTIGKTKAYHGPEKGAGQRKDIQGEEISIIEKLGPDSTLAIDAFSFSNHALLNAILDAHKRGAEVSINLDTRDENKKIALTLLEHGIPVYFFNPNKTCRKVLHNKRMIARYFHNGTWVTKVCEGSPNFTNLAKENEEIMFVTEDFDYFRQHLENHQKITKLCKKAVLQEGTLQKFSATSPVKDVMPRMILAMTPQKNTTVHSFTTNISESILHRIENTQSGDCLDITTMTFDDFSIASALKSAAQRNVAVRLFVDGSALKYSTNHLQELSNNGVKVLVFNHDQSKKSYGKYPRTLHKKSLVRYGGNKPCVVITSANLTRQSNNDSNDCSFFPNNAELAEQLVQENNNLEKKCVPFTSLQVPATQKRARDLFSKVTMEKKQPVVKKGKFEATPTDLLKNLEKAIALLKNDTLASYDCFESCDVTLLMKRFEHLKKLYHPLQPHDINAQVAKQLEQLQALLA